MTRFQLSCTITGILGLLCLEACTAAQKTTAQHPFRRSSVDIPVSLEIGTVRTPEFPVIGEAYFIMLQAEKLLPIRDLECMMGLRGGTQDYLKCAQEPMIEAEWTVSEGGRGVSHGSVSGFGPGQYTNAYLTRFLGQFIGEVGKNYALEAKFTKDGTRLNVTNPHLIVVLVRYH